MLLFFNYSHHSAQNLADGKSSVGDELSSRA